VERYEIGLGDYAHAFMPGHRIRIEISSSAYPMFNPNQNTGAPVATDTEWRTANQTVFHDRQRPSAVVLPVVGD
jgi:predicted acyl esterase